MAASFEIGGIEVPRGQRRLFDLPAARLYTHTPLTMPVQVVRGRRDGPTLFISGVIHGDELNGVEIIRRLLRRSVLKSLRGALITAPVVNVHGLIQHSRYLPDRRDLNRSFPGSEKGSLAARLAHLFMTEIVERCDYGIDIHTGARDRANLPQIRAQLDDPETLELARSFGVPVLLNSDLRDGSLRQHAAERGVRVLLYESGEALRFDELGIRAGVSGILNVMRQLEMLPPLRRPRRTRPEPVIARASGWVRAAESGIVRFVAPLGGRVAKGQRLALISDPFGGQEHELTSPWDGIVIGRSMLPLASEGEALFHIARFKDVDEAQDNVSLFQDRYDPDAPLPP